MNTNSTIDFLSLIADNGDRDWDRLLANASDPEEKKIARYFTTQEVSKLVGRAENTLRAAELRGAIPEAERDARNHRIYRIDQINEIRSALNIHVGRREDDEVCTLGVITYKGGAGKTTTSINLAQDLTLKGYRVLLIDCDPQASATSFFNYIPDRDIEVEDTIYRILVRDERNGLPDHLDPADMRALVRDTHWGGLKLIPANLELYNAEYMLPSEAHRGKGNKPDGSITDRLQMAIDIVAEDFDVIILDSPPSLGMISMNVVKASDGIISPIQPAIVDFASTQQFLRMVVELLQMFGNKDLCFYRVLINNYLRHQRSDFVVDMLRSVYGGYCMTHAMGRTQEINNAGLQLKTIYELSGPMGDAKTYRRAMKMTESVNDEIEGLIKATWPSYTSEQEQ